ncbi:nucleotidyl transferase AbiEii/AbiGii toxin family protein [Acinetobacter ursingii]|uniref:nucleotidyl transferase AbiEii/AbiGii toxin family protein n=1 Tax=Acinetobacter ursingii TaxID=108980 RepID=UPI002E818368|nr:nucleotidyl transferase AbiEii/AbiGii toxin family protein [Acinetobacter ursingii]
MLKQLFEMPNKLEMAFKGGTSLSKVFNIIDRFSEDIDITLDYRQFDVVKQLNLAEGQTAPEHLGSAQRRRVDAALKAEVKSYANDVVAPFLKAQAAALPRAELFEIEVSEDGETIKFTFPPVLNKDSKNYMLEYVLIEFGGRNIINPNEVHYIQPFLASENAYRDVLEFPSSMVMVLAPQRTFWEKATLIHVECHRGVRESAKRLSRHWFDLMALSNHAIGQGAISDVTLLNDVVALKKIFFNASYANYEKCLVGDFVLVPDQQGLDQLKLDFTNMMDFNFINDRTVSFDQIIQSAHDTQALINQTVNAHLKGSN